MTEEYKYKSEFLNPPKFKNQREAIKYCQQKLNQEKRKKKKEKRKKKKKSSTRSNSKNIIVFLLMLFFSGYAVWITYNQILIDNEQRAKDSKENQKILQQARDYNAKLKLEIETLEKDVKQLQDELTATFGSNFSNNTNTSNPSSKPYSTTGYSNSNSKYTKAEIDYVKCILVLDNGVISKTEAKFGCFEMVKVYHPYANYSRIIDYIRY